MTAIARVSSRLVVSGVELIGVVTGPGGGYLAERCRPGRVDRVRAVAAARIHTACTTDIAMARIRPTELNTAAMPAITKAAATIRAVTLHGVTRTPTVPLFARRDGANVEVAASIAVAFGDWDIATPAGYGILNSLAAHGTAEFRLVLRHS